MKDIEKNIAAELKMDPEITFSTSDDDLFKHATTAANKQQGTKDLLALGIVSLWIVFISIFMTIFKKMAPKPQNISTNTTNNGGK
jgi:hypothetical protein